MAVNKWFGLGNLGKDPEVRFLENGNAVCKFSIGINEKYTTKAGEKKEHTEWVNIEAWGKLAELAGQYLVKGSKCFVEGKIKTDKYEKDGQTRYSTKIVASSIQFLSPKDSGTEQSTPPNDDVPF